METSIHISEPSTDHSPIATRNGNMYPDAQIEITLTVHEFSKVKTLDVDLIQKAFSKILSMYDFQIKNFVQNE